jgi:nicotinate phosphoribosyltransferase
MEKCAALYTDLQAFATVDAYLDEGMLDEAVFSLFVQQLPPGLNFLTACGLEEALHALETLCFPREALDYLASLRCFSDRLLSYLERFRFSGEVSAVPEGTPVFPQEPLMEVVAPLPEAQLVETLLLNHLHLPTLTASKAARVVQAAGGRPVMDGGLRRMYGLEVGTRMARAAFIAGVESTSNVLAGHRYGLPLTGALEHSFVQAHEDELESFRAFSSGFPEMALRVDTYDTLRGVQYVIRLARELGEGFRVRALQLCSGDLLALSRAARSLLDEAGLQQMKLFADAPLDEARIARLLEQGAPLDGFCVGPALSVSPDVAALEITYRLVSYAGKDRIKLSSQRALYPGRKQVFRLEEGGTARRDVLARHDEALPGRPLLRPVMREGRPLEGASPPLREIREYAQRALEHLPPELRDLKRPHPAYRVEASPVLAWTREQLIDAWAALP